MQLPKNEYKMKAKQSLPCSDKKGRKVGHVTQYDVASKKKQNCRRGLLYPHLTRVFNKLKNWLLILILYFLIGEKNDM